MFRWFVLVFSTCLLLTRPRVGAFKPIFLVPQTSLPLIVAISSDGTNRNICSGIFVHEHFILTAGQCVQSLDAVRILVGQEGNIVRSFKPDAIFLHPNFSKKLENDIALIKVSNGSLIISQKFKPFTILNRSFLRRNATLVIGFPGHMGCLENLVKGYVRILPRKVCLSYDYFLRDTEMCATSNSKYYQDIGRKSVQFSSGSPFLIETSSSYEVIGIVSNKPWNTYKRSINILNVASYQKWIECIISERRHTTLSPIPTNFSYIDSTVPDGTATEDTEIITGSTTDTFVKADDTTEDESSQSPNKKEVDVDNADTDTYITTSLGDMEWDVADTYANKAPVDVSTIIDSTQTDTQTRLTNNYSISTDATEVDVIKKDKDYVTNEDTVNGKEPTGSIIMTAFTTDYYRTRDIETTSRSDSSESTLTTTAQTSNSENGNDVIFSPSDYTDATSKPDRYGLHSSGETTFVKTSSQTSNLQYISPYEKEKGTEPNGDDNNKSSVLSETQSALLDDSESEGKNGDQLKPILRILVQESPLKNDSRTDDVNIQRVSRIFFPFFKGFGDSISKNINFTLGGNVSFVNSTFTLGGNSSLSVSIEIFPKFQDTLRNIFGFGG